ncbi:CPBP family intramembrane glutamic endopeptidase [Jeotgalibacillus campisalis]|uniref:CAAX prenyl protease 2/Lysostaphin resistance protein A-like domain-containing protein n=1 Tax=Jeotgalibacillus campisalis TaxID=220754 RepID=A0A0C2VWM9_9BACL|nr:hypothetical protein KR50_14140 [Jeotgalibacillus campisalis]
MGVTKIKLTLFIYIGLLITTGYLINSLFQFSPNFNEYRGAIWLLAFICLTLGFRDVREIINPLLNVKFIYKPSAYLYIIISLVIPYLLLLICVHYEILLDETFILNYKYRQWPTAGWSDYLRSGILTPIWEELFFRGVLLFFLIKYTKPFLAICITSILFALFHPQFLIITLVAGVLFSITAYKTNSLIPSLLSHSLWNLFMMSLFA